MWWLRNLEVDEVSFVDKGASGDDRLRPAVTLYKRADAPAPVWKLNLPVSKYDAEKNIAYGWAMIAADEKGAPVVDYQGDAISVDELEKAAHAAFKNASAGDMHRRSGLGTIVESMVVTAEKRAALGLGTGPSGWVVAMKVDDPQLREDVKSGRKAELSIGGRAERVDGSTEKSVSKTMIERFVGLFRKSLEDGSLRLPPVTKESSPVSLEDILSKLPPDLAAALKPFLKSDAPAPQDPMAKALAAMTAEQRAEFERVEKAKADEAEKAELKKRLASLEETEEQRKFVEKASQFEGLPGVSRADMAKLLRAVSKGIDAEDAKKIEGVLKSCAEVVRKSEIFKEYGSAGSGSEGGSAYAQLQAIGKSLREKDPELSESASIVKAAELNPGLNAQYLKERG